jgi:hypothetical protein
MIENRSAWGMAMIAHDLSDAMDRMVDRASRPQPKQKCGDLASPTVAGGASPLSPSVSAKGAHRLSQGGANDAH